jgi:nucleoside-diphosphate-sugar epimerase
VPQSRSRPRARAAPSATSTTGTCARAHGAAPGVRLQGPDLYKTTNRVRIEGTRNLIAGAREVGVGRVVAQSIAFVYAPVGGRVKGEDAPVLDQAPGPFGEALRSVLDLERQVTGAEGMSGIVLRYPS